MPGNDLPNLFSVISIALTLVVILYAGRTVREAKKATAEEEKAVTALAAIVLAQQAAVSELNRLVIEAAKTSTYARESADAARQTVEIAAAAREADRRYRQLEQLRAIGRLAIVIRTEAERELARRVNDGQAITGGAPWRCMEQSQLESELVGADPPLPACSRLVGANQAAEVKADADQANAELRGVFRSLGVGA